MIKKLLLFMLLSATPLLGMAVEKGVLITHTDGTTSFLSLNKEVKVTFPNSETVKFSQTGSNDLELNVFDVSDFKISEYGSKIVDTMTESIGIRMSEKQITVFGLSPAQTIRLHDINGKQMSTMAPSTKGTVNIATDGLSNGVYLISISNGKTYKFLKR